MIRRDKVETLGAGRVVIQGSFRPNGTDAPKDVKGKGYSVARTSAGLYTVTFDDKFPQFLGCKATARVATATPTEVQAGDFVAASKTLQLRVLQDVKQTKAILLPISEARELSGDATINAAGNGGLLASDTTPIFDMLSSAKEIGLSWVASNSDEIAWTTCLPPDFDHTVAAVFKARAQVTKAGGAIVDHVPVTVEAFFGTDGADAGGATDHITTGTMMTITKTLTVGNQAAYPNNLTVMLSPAAHTTDSIQLSAAWIEYTSTQYGAPVLVDMTDDADNEINFEAAFSLYSWA